MEYTLLLVEGRIVELKSCGNSYMFIVNDSKEIISTFESSNLKIKEFDETLTHKCGDYIQKIYENTKDGLKCIWDRDTADFTDWTSIPVDTKVLVSNDKEVWVRRYFSHYNKEDKGFYAFRSGSDSWSSDNTPYVWKHCKLYKEE